MDINTLKSKIQGEVIDLWSDRGYNGYSLISMGVGKSRIIALAIQRYLKDHPEFDYKKYDHPIVVLVNSGELRDSDLPKELKKWGVTVKVKIVCYQTAYRWKKKIGLLIADELDFAITEGMRYLQVFNKCTYDNWLGMTGTMVEAKGEVAEELFKEKPFYELPLSEAQDLGLINKTIIWIHEVPLYTSSTPTAPYGEVRKYEWIQGNINDCKSKISGIYEELEGRPTEDRAYDLRKMLGHLYNKKEYWESKRSNANCRMTMMHTAKSLSDYAIKLKSVILDEKPENKVLIFSELTDQVDRITPYAYHGKQSDRTVVDQFNTNEIREMGVVRKVNRGVNFVELNHAIVHAYTSSVTNATQAYIGRMVRLEPSKYSTVHFLVSYYWDGDEKVYCQNGKWLNNILNSSELKHLSINIFDGINL